MIKELHHEKLYGVKKLLLNDISNPILVGFNEEYMEITGSSSDMRMKNAIAATIGEFVERKNLFRNFLFPNKCNNVGISLLDYSLFTINDFNRENTRMYFADSCGSACHINSEKAILGAFTEFVERQTFIFRYLSKTKKNVLIHNKIFQSIVPEIFHNIEFYDISLTNKFYVIFAIGTINKNVIIGLGSGFSIDKAILRTVKELYQTLSYYINDRILKAKGVTDRKTNKNDYFDIFIKLPPDRIIDSYNFLKDSNEIDIADIIIPQVSLQAVIKELNKLFGFNPILFNINSYDNENVTKNVKVVDFGWFPCLSPYVFTESIYKSVEAKTNSKLDRNCNFIPFP